MWLRRDCESWKSNVLLCQETKNHQSHINSRIAISRASRKNEDLKKKSVTWLLLGEGTFSFRNQEVHKYMNSNNTLHLGVVYHTFDFSFLLTLRDHPWWTCNLDSQSGFAGALRWNMCQSSKMLILQLWICYDVAKTQLWDQRRYRNNVSSRYVAHKRI